MGAIGSATISVVIADDDPRILAPYAHRVARFAGMSVLGTAHNGLEAVRQVRRLHPTLVLMDVDMPLLNGAEATARILAERPGTSVVALSAHLELDFVLPMMRAGACGYLAKDLTADRLESSLRLAAGGQLPMAPAVTAALLRRAAPPPDNPGLSEAQIRILHMVGDGFTNSQIGRRGEIAGGTGKKDLHHAVHHTRDHNRTHAVTLAIKRGLIDINSRGEEGRAGKSRVRGSSAPGGPSSAAITPAGGRPG